MRTSLLHLALVSTLLAGLLAKAQSLPSVAGWDVSMPTPGTHRVATDLAQPHGGTGCATLFGPSMQAEARACLVQEFFGATALTPGKTYRYAVWYRTGTPFAGQGQLLIDSYTAAGEKGRRELVSTTLGLAVDWTAVAGEITVPEKAVRIRLLLYLRKAGQICWDDAFFGDPAAGAPNLLKNGGFEPSAAAVYDLAPAAGTGQVKLTADFENGVIGKVKEMGPDEFYAYAFPEDKPRSSFLWFHFRVEGCAGREVTFHINPAPFGRDKTGGNGTRLPVMSYDQDTWSGIAGASWNEDGTVLTFKQRFTASPAWIASFFPYPPDRVSRFIAAQRANPAFAASVIGKTAQGRDLRLYTLTDPAVAEADKRILLFTTLQHDLETSGALALEGLCRFLLADDPRAAALRRGFVVYAVPMMDPDGIAQGNLYCPAGNLNRQWGQGTTAETTAVETFVRQLGARGRTVELSMDFHGWCIPERRTEFMSFGKEITDERTEAEAKRLIAAISPRLSGKIGTNLWRKRVETVTGITSDLNRLACGWLRFEAGARLAYSIEIFGEGECTQEQYLTWGQAFAEGIADFYATP